MIIRSMAAALAALTLTATPVAAQVATNVDRSSAPAQGANALRGDRDGSPGAGILAILAAALIIAGIYIAVDEDDDDALSD